MRYGSFERARAMGTCLMRLLQRDRGFNLAILHGSQGDRTRSPLMSFNLLVSAKIYKDQLGQYQLHQSP